MLTDVEREHLFLLGLGRPPEVRYQAAEGVTPRLQHVLDALAHSPAYVKNSTWDIVAWNHAASVVLQVWPDGSAATAAVRVAVIADVRPATRSTPVPWPAC